MKISQLLSPLSSKFKSSNTKEIQAQDVQTHECTYHGWVLIPLDLGDDKRLPFETEEVMLKLGKRVATSQVKVRTKGQAAVCSVTSNGFEINRVHAPNTPPPTQSLLRASLETISCILVSQEMALAVIMAFTFDEQGKQGIGCDVIRFGPTQSKQTDNMCRRFAQQVNSFVGLTSSEEDGGEAENEVPSNPTLPPVTMIPEPSLKSKRRSSCHYNTNIYLEIEASQKPAIDISGADGGYLTVDMVNGIVEEPTGSDHGYIVVGRRPSCIAS
eukprot:m.217657 g.217657  ORF g.217657 m.217657 type:complete len:271 (-) comp33241_c0_seq2:339-1151(-)